MNTKKYKRYLFLVAFIEGSTVMAIELAGAKMIAPYYGTSLYVWAAVLAVTLGGLTSGYFIGGSAAYRFPGPKLLISILLSGTILVALMPVIALNIMPATEGFGLRTASLISATGFMFLPLICMGMVSPVIIQLSNAEIKTTGKTAGTVYAVSTIGGIIMTLLMGFYMLPEWGIRNSIFFSAALFGSLTVLYVILFRKHTALVGTGLIILILLFLASFKPFKNPKLALKFLYQSEGILAQVSVLDNPQPETGTVYRLLFINQIPQAQVTVNDMPASFWTYPHRLAILSSIKPANSNVLLIGMGGGTLAMEMKKMGFNVDIVEIDQRMPFVAKKYFGFDPENVNVFIDDGRHYINSTKKKYALVVLDVLNGESQPYHLLTMEAFEALKKITTPDALLLINFQGFIRGEHGRAGRSIYRTLQEAGFQVTYYFSEPDERDGDLHMIASLHLPDFHKINESRLNACCISTPHEYNDLITSTPLALEDAVVLRDDKPMLEDMNNYWNEQWRKKTLRFLKKMEAFDIPFFQ